MFKQGVLNAASLPRHWLLPRNERALLAIVGVTFWAGTIWQAVTHDAANASVFSFFGLGLFYVIFSLSNLAGGLRTAIGQYTKGLVTKLILAPLRSFLLSFWACWFSTPLFLLFTW
jgi:hypothetical protein